MLILLIILLRLGLGGGVGLGTMKKAASASSKALHPHATVASGRAADSFQNFEARIGYGTGNVAATPSTI